MSLTLYGSIPSPYVRRIRILLHDVDFHFEVIDLMNNEDQVKLLKISPVRRIPILKDQDTIIYDSRQIYNYLAKKLSLKALTIHQENLLTFIDEVNDSLVSVRLLNSSGFNDIQNTFMRNQYKRIKDTLRFFEKEITLFELDESDYVQVCLFCLLDWIAYRELVSLEEFKNLENFRNSFSSFERTKKNSPRL
ncbi:glutathione S-transferase family protein [Halobacteriovorax sp. HLS]|uniref:glutathione S-transferase family protein n=1 Tax=Halobacteriovorax sp. HLS TaxID=2234000 RepID=UPI000FDBEDCE|nr:glutathione S-transferase family protein [Halobacteriovorax sp. HLS]